MSSGLAVFAMCPGSVFAVGGVVAQAAVEDADESVAEGAQCLMVHVARGAVLVVESAGTRAAGERTESPLVDGVVEAAVADVTGQNGACQPSPVSRNGLPRLAGGA